MRTLFIDTAMNGDHVTDTQQPEQPRNETVNLEAQTERASGKAPFVPPRLTKHGRLEAITQNNRYSAVFQQNELFTEISP